MERYTGKENRIITSNEKITLYHGSKSGIDGIISYRFRYWGEMITYLGMTMPMAIWSTITWIRNPSKENTFEL